MILVSNLFKKKSLYKFSWVATGSLRLYKSKPPLKIANNIISQGASVKVIALWEEMPGNIHWFREIFGFSEAEAGSFQNVRSKFEFNEETGVLTSLENKRSFNVGQFETPSTAELRSRLDGMMGDGDKVKGEG